MNLKIAPLALAAWAAAASPGLAATFNVTRTDDPAPDACLPEDCSAREAILAANLAPGSTVNLPAGTYRLSIPHGAVDPTDPPGDGAKGNLVVKAPMSIVGAGREATIVDARPNGDPETRGVDRVLSIGADATDVSISGLTISGGSPAVGDFGLNGQGGCVFVFGGRVAMTDVRVTECFGPSGGGGIAVISGVNAEFQNVEGALTMTNGEVSHGDAIAPPPLLGGTGGGIQVLGGSAVLIDSVVADCRSLGGGGIAVGRQDILPHPDDLTLIRTEVARNYASGGGGGIAVDSGNTTIRDAFIHDNIASFAGGGLNIFGSTKTPTVLVEGSTISANASGANEDGSSPDLPTGSGGGIRNSNGKLTVRNSTIAGNDARGILIGGTVRSSGFGGGIADTGPTGGADPIVTIVNSTIAYNVGVSSSQLWEFSTANGSPLGVVNSVIAGTGAPDAAPNCGKNGPKDGFKSLGGNVSSDASPCRLTEPTDLANAGTPGLDAALADNGGPTDTLKLLAGSPALGRGLEAYCPETDQRGVAREKPGCDSGAYEFVDAQSLVEAQLQDAVDDPMGVVGPVVPVLREVAGL